MERIKDIILNIMENLVDFVDIQLDNINDYEELSSCMGLDKILDKNEYCTFMRQNTCLLVLPLNNLYSERPNQEIYYNKLTDELIRYVKIRNYIFTTSEYLSFDYVSYKIKHDEIILLEDIYDLIVILMIQVLQKTINILNHLIRII